jgi:NAD(P)H-dependent FMN reductase
MVFESAHIPRDPKIQNFTGLSGSLAPGSIARTIANAAKVTTSVDLLRFFIFDLTEYTIH